MPDMNHQRWIKPLLITLLLCCAAPLSVAGDEPTATSQEQAQKATEQTAQTAEPFTIAVLPDTQFYCDCRLKLSAKWGNGDLRRYFFEQTEWVRDNQKRLNIAFLVHEGDIVQTDAPEEWAIARKPCLYWTGKCPTACAWETMTWVLRRRTISMAAISASTGPLISTPTFLATNSQNGTSLAAPSIRIAMTIPGTTSRPQG